MEKAHLFKFKLLIYTIEDSLFTPSDDLCIWSSARSANVQYVPVFGRNYVHSFSMPPLVLACVSIGQDNLFSELSATSGCVQQLAVQSGNDVVTSSRLLLKQPLLVRGGRIVLGTIKNDCHSVGLRDSSQHEAVQLAFDEIMLLSQGLLHIEEGARDDVPAEINNENE